MGIDGDGKFVGRETGWVRWRGRTGQGVCDCRLWGTQLPRLTDVGLMFLVGTLSFPLVPRALRLPDA
jgi:hypothetical protein